MPDAAEPATRTRYRIKAHEIEAHGKISFEHPSRYAATSIVNWTNES